MTTDWRRGRSILVMDAHAMGALAAVRSLGRAGYRVIAASPRGDALALRSRYCAAPVRLTDPGHDGYFDALDRLLAEQRIDAIVPSEGFLLRIRPRFDRYAALLPVPADPSVMYRAFAKWDLFEASAGATAREHLPPFLLLDRQQRALHAADLESLPEPVFVKTDAVHADPAAAATGAGGVRRCATRAAALEAAQRALDSHRRALLQGFVPGIGVGAFIARWHDRTLAEFMHRRVHEVPHTGGVSSYRRSWRHAAVMQDARTRLGLLGWQGVGMVEYRWDPASDRFWLMELNARFWGSLHLALAAGVDFPRLLLDAFFGQPQPPVTDYADVGCRLTFPAEVEYVLSCLRDRSLPLARRLAPLPEFVLLGLQPGVYADLSFPGDRVLYLHGLLQSLRRWTAR